MADLLFTRPARAAGAPPDLLFGDDDSSAAPPQRVAVGTLRLGGPRVTAAAQYDNRNPRRLGAAVAAPHQVAERAERQHSAAWQLTQPRAHTPAVPHALAAPVAHQPAAAWQASARARTALASGWQAGQARSAATAAPWTLTNARHTAAAAPWVLASTGMHATAALVHQAALALALHARDRFAPATPVGLHAIGRYGAGSAIRAQTTGVWQRAMPLPPGRSAGVLPPLPPLPPPHAGTTHLVFACQQRQAGAPWLLLFGSVCNVLPPDAAFVIRPARFYMSVHTLTLHLLPGLQPLPITEATVSADMGSTGWTLSASGPASLFDALEPVSALQPRRVRLTIDGIQWVFVVDSVSRTEAFGQRGARIAGRSPSALLASPYALQATRANAAQATAQQLAELALDGTGFALDWGLDDWLIPAGVYSHQGTPLAAVQAIAEAAGGHVLSHRSADALLVRHPYPTLAGGVPGGPWNWTQPTVQPDVVLAADAVITLGTERRDTAPVNGVWVSGVNAGVSRLVRRSGTAGDQLAPQQVDPLITADAAAQQRGLAVLGAAGSKHLQQVQLPILVGSGQPGVLDVGQLVQVNTSSPWRGRVRAVSARSVFGGQVSQTVALERHIAA